MRNNLRKPGSSAQGFVEPIVKSSFNDKAASDADVGDVPRIAGTIDDVRAGDNEIKGVRLCETRRDRQQSQKDD